MTNRIPESENAPTGLQMRPGWIHVWREGPSTIKARRWDPDLGIWVLIPVAEWAQEMQADPTDPTWAPPPPAPHGGER